MKFSAIQQKLNAPKNLYNKFGNYSYRSCESILEAVKPLLGEAILTITDDIVEVGGRIYVKATARFVDGDFNIENTAFAREEEVKKGMDASQITGSASSYARKYALNGLFLIDDVKDADTADNSKNNSLEFFKEQIENATDEKQLGSLWYKYKVIFAQDSAEYKELNKLAGVKKLAIGNPDLKVG